MSLLGFTSDILGSGSNVTSGTSTATGSTSGGLVDDVGASLISSIPVVGGILQGLWEKLGVAANIELVKKYGWSSWGASTSPEKMKAQFAENVYPWLKQNLEGINAKSAEGILNHVDLKLRVNLDYFKKLRKYHARAESTQLALDWAISETDKLIRQGIEPLVTALKSKGVKIVVTSFSASPDGLNIVDMADNDGVIRNGDVINNPLSLKKYTVDVASFEAMTTVAVDETGNVTTSSSSSGFGTLLTLGGLAFAVFKGGK